MFNKNNGTHNTYQIKKVQIIENNFLNTKIGFYKEDQFLRLIKIEKQKISKKYKKVQIFFKYIF